MSQTLNDLAVASGSVGKFMNGTYVPFATNSGGSSFQHDSTKVNKTDITNIEIKGSINDTGSVITAGTYFYLNGNLVKAKTDVAINGTFTNGTNYENVSVGEVLTELNNKFLWLSYGGISGTIGANGQLINAKTDTIPYSSTEYAVASCNISYWSAGVLYGVYGDIISSNGVNTLRIHLSGRPNDTISSVRVEVLLVRK